MIFWKQILHKSDLFPICSRFVSLNTQKNRPEWSGFSFNPRILLLGDDNALDAVVAIVVVDAEEVDT